MLGAFRANRSGYVLHHAGVSDAGHHELLTSARLGGRTSCQIHMVISDASRGIVA